MLFINDFLRYLRTPESIAIFCHNTEYQFAAQAWKNCSEFTVIGKKNVTWNFIGWRYSTAKMIEKIIL